MTSPYKGKLEILDLFTLSYRETTAFATIIFCMINNSLGVAIISTLTRP